MITTVSLTYIIIMNIKIDICVCDIEQKEEIIADTQDCNAHSSSYSINISDGENNEGNSLKGK